MGKSWGRIWGLGLQGFECNTRGSRQHQPTDRGQCAFQGDYSLFKGLFSFLRKWFSSFQIIIIQKGKRFNYRIIILVGIY
jgi:hypothetical protein